MNGSLHYIVGGAALICGAACGMAASLANLDMMDQVNAKLPVEKQFDPLGLHFLNRPDLRGEYKRLYPEGRLLVRLRILTVVMFASIGISALSLDVFGK